MVAPRHLVVTVGSRLDCTKSSKIRHFFDEPCQLNHSENDVRRGRGAETLRESLWVAPYWFLFLKVFFQLKQYDRISHFNTIVYDNGG